MEHISPNRTTSFEPDAETKCEDHLKLALELDPTDPEVYQTLASVRLSQSRNAEAQQILRQGWALWRHLDPANPLFPAFSTRSALAQLFIETQLYAPAVNVLRVLEQDDDEDVQIQYLLGLAWTLLAEGKSTGSETSDDVDDIPDGALECRSEARAALEHCFRVRRWPCETYPS